MSIAALKRVAFETEPDVDPDAGKTLLRVLTCGSVDDGKSTLIGRLLYDAGTLSTDQVAALEGDSRRFGTQGDKLDFALLVDGLSAEREQGITIDVAYRFFATPTRKFIVADTPGHEQYTRNMVTGASTADLAIILVDATRGVMTQTRRHSFLVQLLGIRHLVLAVNKMDLTGFDQARFDAIVADYAAFARGAGIGDFTAIPLSGLTGDNVYCASANMPWYRGPTLIEHLEASPSFAAEQGSPFRMPVQWVNRPDAGFRGYAGTIASGTVRPGDAVAILPTGAETRVARIVTFDSDLTSASAGHAVTLTLSNEVDCSRGDMIATAHALPAVTDRIDATLVWMGAEPLIPGRAYWLKIGSTQVSASVARIRETIDVNSLERHPRDGLELNEIGLCEIVLDRPVAAALYSTNHALGGFILIDRASNATVAAGMISRLGADGQPDDRHDAGVGRVLWLTGASDDQRRGFARKAGQRFAARGRASVILDPAALHEGLNRDLGTSGADATEARRRMEEVAGLISRSGVTVLAIWDDAEAAPGTMVDVSDPDPGDWVI